MNKKFIAFLSLLMLCVACIFAKELTGVKVRFSDTQLEITTNQTLHNVRFRLNGDYTYKVKTLSPGTYTVGLATFTDTKGNRFNPFSIRVQRVSIFCSEGSTYVLP